MTRFMSFWLSGKSFAQVICWDRGRPARNEREARKSTARSEFKSCAPAARCGRGRPGSKQITCARSAQTKRDLVPGALDRMRFGVEDYFVEVESPCRRKEQIEVLESLSKEKTLH